ncbi:hypothetical protein MYAM1_002485 [Malassezia yamatoensis]|uniref:Ams2/SPT21 N-terminal domain-containing protein n=1 Tax=Malassezia yamatoensis TaxID=253288 RepID=A0AAJ5YUP6_9BASI|nr:hypothetical protein MYAM1_002485 [Malassezia yamatoensis]
MIARGSKKTSVRVAYAPMPLGALGRVSLKTCLGMICVASPELVLDRTNDYIVYAVDPEESYRAMQRSPTHRLHESRSHSSTDPRDSPSRRAVATQVLVGKGFMRNVLEEHGDGSAFITGRVRSESKHTYSAFSSDEDDEETSSKSEILEVVLRIKEAPQQSREQLQHLLQGIGESRKGATTSTDDAPANDSRSPHTASSAHANIPTAEQRQLMSMLHVIAGALPEQKPRHTPPEVLEKRSVSPATTTPSANGNKSDRICYNCGTTTSKTWRMLQLPIGEHVSHPQSEKPPADVVPMTWTPKYAQHSSCVADGETRWQACNACGLYFTKYSTSRSAQMCAGVRNEKKRESRAPKRIKYEVYNAAENSAVHSSHPTFSHDSNAKQSTVTRPGQCSGPSSDPSELSLSREVASSPLRSAKMPPPPALTSPSVRNSRNVRAVTPGQYAVPSYLIHSSPSTAMNRLLSETEQDFEEIHPSGQFPTPGKLMSIKPHHLPTSPGMLRRSPRKRPHGTLAQVNPYASNSIPCPAPNKTSDTLFAKHAPKSNWSSSANPSLDLSPGLWSGAKRRNGLGESPSNFAFPLEDSFECPPSPSAERASRAERRNVRGISSSPSSGTDLTLPTSSASLATPNGPNSTHDLSGLQHHSWLSAEALSAMHDPRKASSIPPQDQHPSKFQVSNDPQPGTPTQSTMRRSSSMTRPPLPVTVEDGSSSQQSSAHNSPESAVEYIEDPYGLLSASGFAQYDKDGNLVLGEGLNLDALQGIELHSADSFGDHLRDFTTHGGLGLAAHLGQTNTPHVESFSGNHTGGNGIDAMLDDPGVLALLANCHNDASTQHDSGAEPVVSS